MVDNSNVTLQRTCRINPYTNMKQIGNYLFNIKAILESEKKHVNSS